MNEQIIFVEALQQPPDKREAFLHKACAADPQLRRRIESLLTAHDNAGEFMVRPAGALTGAHDVAHAEKPGTRIGRYKLLELIGEGGFGDVYMAEQQEPVRRKVALKIIKLGMDTRQVIARFDAERQALALMDHPNIARVLDAGATETGRPYFVMDLVRGVPITRYCDAHNLATHERLQLFIDVCRAVQHAHQKGIIHRDIKPSNVLVTEHDGKPVPKIIDFGVAKATQQRLTEKTLFTEHRQLVGTPEYMSPEQATFGEADVDTRCDIYSLGVVLYELIVGATPFDAKALRSRGYDEICRVIREVDPATPSNKLSALGSAATDVCKCRQAQPAALRKLLRGDLDWILMKCLEKDRTRRYPTANALARDMGRVLSDQPVEACPPSAAYRLHKFIRRHKIQVYAALLLLLSLVAGIVGTTIGFVRSRIEARRTSDALARLEEQLQRATSNVQFARGQSEQHLLDQVAGYRIYLGTGSGEELRELSLHPTSILDWDWAPRRAKQVGSVFVWLSGSRPQAIGTVSRRLWKVREFRHDWDVAVATRHELHSLAHAPLQATYRGQRVWSAPPAGIVWELVPGAPTPARTEHLRLTQLATMAGQFTADTGTDRKAQLTLKPDPVYRYDIHGAELTDGAVFTFLHVTDPELVLIIETPDTGPAARWHFAAARLTEKSISVCHQGKPVWQDMARAALALDRNILECPVSQEQSYVSYVPAAIPQIEMGESLRKLAHDYEMHSLSLWQARRPAEAHEAQTEAKKMWKQLEDHFADDPTYRLQLAKTRAYMAEAHRSAGRIAEARTAASDTVNLFRRLTVDFPNDYRVHRSLAYMYGELGQWHEANAAYKQAAQLDPDPASRCRWYESALLPWLGAGDLAAYRAGCEELLAQYGDTEDPGTAWWLTGICLYAPDAVKDTDHIITLAAATGSPEFEAAALYRAGRYEEAAELLSELAAGWEGPDELQADPIRPYKRLIAAMAFHQIGHTEAARGQLDKVIRWLDEAQTDHSGIPVAHIDRLNWCYRVTLNPLRQEAEELLGKPPARKRGQEPKVHSTRRASSKKGSGAKSAQHP